uniref:EGF-like domain-containing protein n=1 Tax=Magallana gigas TaxID=29159 RepID=A0A8W8NUV9_MAGGI|nr:multiple epidermal growth factor-like domains protein 10 isoform X2 [Crassostrea gigas]
MADKNPYLYVLLLSNGMIVNGYLQFVVPGVTQTDSSPIFSSGTYNYWPNRTVDGNFSQSHQACLHTAIIDVSEAWLRVDLQTVRSVKFVKFWYRNDRGSAFLTTIRLRGYSIRVSNSSDVSPGSTDACFIDDMSETLPTVIQEECERTTRYVWFYQVHIRDSNDKVPILEICEVQIFGCETGTYGVNCSKRCSHCKNNGTCDIDTGECDDNGCALSGFKSPLCGDCLSGLYGKECNLNCSQFCHGKVCYQITGECINGCEDGYIGGLCTILCPNGYFGRKCLETCGKCLDDRTCDNVNGTCIDGCIGGFEGDLCKTECSPGEYGRNCQFRCSDHCYNNEVCDTVFGNCSKCAEGFDNAKCTKQCDSGYYGESCMFQCGHCLDNITCNNINGTCPGGCMSGWQNTDKCDTPCKNGTFGVLCMYKCSGNCLNNETCDKSDGGCKNCAPGWEGPLCSKACDIGRYGLNCQHVCGHCFKAEQCFRTNGSCSGGCMEGYRGEMCLESIGALGSTQDSETSYVAIIAVLVAVIVALMTVIAVLVFILRNARKKNETNSQVNDIDMYDLPNAKPENSVYDLISSQ